MADAIRIRLLGGFDAGSGDASVPAGSWRLRKAKTLVKLLALHPTHTLHRDQVIDVLWPDLGPDAGRNNLSQALHAARRALSTLGVDGGEVISLSDDLLTLGRDTAVVVDVDELRATVADARVANDIEAAAAALAGAPSELLPEDAYEPWHEAPATAYRTWRSQAVMDLVDEQLRRGQAADAVVLLTPLVAADPLHEPAIRGLMRSLAASGRRSEALLVYERLRRSLREELGADPEAETRDIFRELLRASQVAAVAVPAQRGAGSLPAAVTALVGRERELTETMAILARTRLLTFTGMGGAGKSVLAVELARRCAPDYAGGAYLVELAALTDGRQVALQIARRLQLELPTDAPPVASMAAQIGDRPLLVVIDNCEHLLDATAQVVSDLMHACPRLRVVATSREPLRVEGEVSWRTPSLALPDITGRVAATELTKVASVELFVRRASAALPGFAVTDDNAVAVAQICFRLDGIPLAIELAAACVPVLSPQQIAERLDDSMTLLRRGDRAAITRQQTLEATLAWSHELLEPVEQAVFRQLAVFAGSFTLAAAEAVCSCGAADGDVLLALARLVDTSLVVVDQRADVTRYRLLETVRQYALDRLRASGEQLDVMRRHCDCYLAFAKECDPDLEHQSSVLPPNIDVEQDNLRAALRFALEHDPPAALELATSMWRYWLVRGYFREGRGWLEAALEAAREPSPVRARALVALAVFDVRRGVSGRLEALGQEAVQIQRDLGDPRGLGEALRADAVLAFMRGVWDDCRQRTLELHDAARRYGLPEQATAAAHLQAFLLLSRGDLPAARAAFGALLGALDSLPVGTPPFLAPLQLGMAVETEGDDVRLYFEETVLHGRLVAADVARGFVLSNIADLERLEGDHDAALSLLLEAAESFTRAGDIGGEAYISGRLGCLRRVRGELTESRDALSRCLELRRAIGDRRGIGLTQTSLGILAATEGDAVTGRALIEDALSTSADIQDVAAQVGFAVTLASVLADSEDYDEAERLLRAWLPRSEQIAGNQRGTPWAHLTHAGVLSRLGRADEASYAAEEARRLFAAIGAVDGLRHLETRSYRVQVRR